MWKKQPFTEHKHVAFLSDTYCETNTKKNRTKNTVSINRDPGQRRKFQEAEHNLPVPSNRFEPMSASTVKNTLIVCLKRHQDKLSTSFHSFAC